MNLERAVRSRPNMTAPPTRQEHLEAARLGKELTGEFLAQMRAAKEQQLSKPLPATVQTTSSSIASLETKVDDLSKRLKRIEAELYRSKLTGLLR